jgi:S1-C subfamily serine protease
MPNSLVRAYRTYRSALVKIGVRTAKGDQATGTGFHIGSGMVVTAKHILQGNELVNAVREPNLEAVEITQHLAHPETEMDVLVLKTNIPETATHIPLGTHLNEWIKDEFVLSKALIMGYPRIPLADRMFLVCAEAEVNATINLLNSKTPHFVLSSTARGGFSGGPVISDDGKLLGMITKSLLTDNAHESAGFCTAISVQPIIEVLAQLPTRPVFIPGDIWDRFKKSRPFASVFD